MAEFGRQLYNYAFPVSNGFPVNHGFHGFPVFQSRFQRPC